MLKEYRIGFGIGYREDGSTVTDEQAEKAMEAVLFAACHRFGGFNLTRGEGGWISPDGRLVRENSATVSVLTHNHADYVRAFARIIRELFEQYSVILIHPDGSAEFIEA